MPTFRKDLHLGHEVPLVERDDIHRGAVTTDKIDNGAITTDKIADGAVTTVKITDGAVTTEKIGDGEVHSEDIADGAVTKDKIAPGAVDDLRAAFQDLLDNYRPIVINGDVTNAPDEEDITSVDGLLKLKNRSSALSNMGYVILRHNRPFAEQVSLINTIYEIRYDFDLGGESFDLDFTEADTHTVSEITYYYLTFTAAGDSYTLLDDKLVFIDSEWNGLSARTIKPEAGTTFMIASISGGIYANGCATNAVTIPENCVLKFEGGSLRNGAVICNNTNIINVSGFCSTTLVYAGTITGVDYVTYSMFGARLDGSVSEFYIFKACHAMANTYGIPVIQKSGIINIDGNHEGDNIIVKTDTDLSGCSLVITDATNTYGNGINNPHWGYYIKDDNEFVDYTQIIRNNKGQFTLGTTHIDALKEEEYSQKLYVANGTRVLGVRIDSGLVYYNKDVFTVLTNGAFGCAPLYCDFSEDPDENEGHTLSLYGKSINTAPITFKAPIIVFNKNTYNYPFYRNLFYFDRSNTTLYLPSDIQVENFPTEAGAAVTPCLFTVENAFRFCATGGVDPNVGYVIGHDVHDSHYVIRFTACDKIMMKDMCLFKGWGAMNTEFVKDVTVKDSILNRFDNHFGIGNLDIMNTTIVGNNNGVNIGYGLGKANLNSVKYIYEPTSTVENSYSFVQLRKDLGLRYVGEINIRDCYFKGYFPYTGQGTTRFFIVATASYRPGQDYGSYMTSIGGVSVYIDTLYIEPHTVVSEINLLAALTTPGYDVDDVFDNVVFRNINSELFGTFIRTRSYEGQQPSHFIINNLIVENCNLPRFAYGNMTSPIDNPNWRIINMSVLNSYLPSASQFTKFVENKYNAVNSTIRFTNAKVPLPYVEGTEYGESQNPQEHYTEHSVITCINCDIIPGNSTTIDEEVYMWLAMFHAQFVKCKFLSNGSLTKLRIDKDFVDHYPEEPASYDERIMIGCMLDSDITLQYNRMYQILRFYRRSDGDIPDPAGTGDPMVENQGFFSESRKRVVFSYHNQWWTCDGQFIDTRESGTWDQKPNAYDNNLRVGFQYLCTDKIIDTTDPASETYLQVISGQGGLIITLKKRATQKTDGEGHKLYTGVVGGNEVEVYQVDDKWYDSTTGNEVTLDSGTTPTPIFLDDDVWVDTFGRVIE